MFQVVNYLSECKRKQKLYVFTFFCFYSMNKTHKSNFKRIREMLLTDRNETDENVHDYPNFDSDNEYDPIDTESDDTSTDEHISEQFDSSDSDVDHRDIVADSQPETLQKGGAIWSAHPSPAEGRIPAANIMKRKPGFTTKIQTILDAFKLFFTNEILDEIIFHTNCYAERCFDQAKRLRQNSNTKKRNFRRWKPIDRIELESFIGLLIQSGVSHSNHELLNDLWDISQSRPLYRATMSLQRFRYILQFIRFDDRQRRNTSDRLSPIRNIFERFVQQLPRHFIPGEYLTVDEQLYQHMPYFCYSRLK